MADKAEETKTETTDFEKRYNDSQAHIDKIEAENKTYREESQKDKQLFDQISQYVDWDAVNGTKTEPDDEGYVDKTTLNKTVKEIQNQIARNEATNNFRSKFPDMVPYEDLVAVYYGKTDARRSTEERIAKAVENVKTLLESERAKGREAYESEKKETVAKEAEVGGLTAAKGPEGTKKEAEGETYDEYIAYRKQQADRQWAPNPVAQAGKA